MTRENRNALIASAVALAVFVAVAALMPAIMLRLGEVSTAAAVVFAGLFIAAPFIVLWLRARAQRKGRRD